MRLHLEWTRPIVIKDASRQNLIYAVDQSKLPQAAGVYVFGRRWGTEFEALYVGKANNIRSRVKVQLNNLRLMQHLKNAKAGKRIVFAGRFVGRPGQQPAKSLTLVERALIRHFLSEAHDLVNRQGTILRRHEITSAGKHRRAFVPRLMYLERAKGE